MLRKAYRSESHGDDVSRCEPKCENHLVGLSAVYLEFGLARVVVKGEWNGDQTENHNRQGVHNGPKQAAKPPLLLPFQKESFHFIDQTKHKQNTAKSSQYTPSVRSQAAARL